MNNNLAIIGAGGFAREVECWAKDRFFCTFYAEDEYAGGIVKPLSSFDPQNSLAVIAIGDPNQRRRIAESMPVETKWTTLIHPSVQILDREKVLIMPGSIICAGTIITTNVNIGSHSHLNLNTTVGHDCDLGDYFTTAPTVNISGNVKARPNVYIGTNAAIRQGVYIAGNVTIGMGAIVLNDINNGGTYVGLVK
jgi:sugar O-acyltransferase (sialic acid O-acetyltransferase NeuD family)